MSGELRILGLFTSMALATPHSEVPIIRRKVAEVMRRSGLPPSSHAGKALMNALDSYPRDELFQIGDRPALRVRDADRQPAGPAAGPGAAAASTGSTISSRSSSTCRASGTIPTCAPRSALHLAARYDGRVSAYYPHFPEGELVRVHFIIGRDGGRDAGAAAATSSRPRSRS